MGLCTSSGADTKKEQQGQMLKHKLKVDRLAELKLIKILLIGAGESGKSTILKQMKIIHQGQYSDDERLEMRPLVYLNTVEAMQLLIRACYELNIPLQSQMSHAASVFVNGIDLFDDCVPSPQILVELRIVLPMLWEDAGVQKAFARGNEFSLPDSCEYFMTSVERTFVDDYIPTEQDVLRTRKPTANIVEMRFTLQHLTYCMFDVGGQRGERKKWIHFFHQVNAIMFIASLSEYDQSLEEDPTRNRMQESLKLFDGIVNLHFFKDTAIILFLNKCDIFENKIYSSDLGDYFPDYDDVADYDKALEFIRKQYKSKNKVDSKLIFMHVTNATDTNSMQFVWQCSKAIIMNSNLTKAGLWQ